MRRFFFVLTALFAAQSVYAQSSPDTYFIDLSRTLSRRGDYVYQEFTVSQTTTLDLRFAMDYSADAAILLDGELSNFINNRGYRGYGIFDSVFGTKTKVTIPRGRYYAAVRSEASAANTVRFEVDYNLSLDDAYRYDWYFGDAKYVQPNGGKVWQPFTIEDGIRYFVDGCNSGVEVYVIPNSELSNFIAGRSFRYYSDFAGEDNAYPGLWELDLSPGDYALVFRNQETVAHAVTWQAERWIPFSRRFTGAAAPSLERLPGGETKGLRSASVDVLGTVQLMFSERLDAVSLARSQFRISTQERTVFPSNITYDPAQGVVTLTAPELKNAHGFVTVSWQDLATADGTLSGGTDPLRAPAEARRVTTASRTLAIKTP